MGAAAKKVETEQPEAPSQPALAAVPAAPMSIYRAMPAVMRDVGPVAKARRNAQQGYDFRGIDEVYEAVQLILAKHGIFVVPYVQGQVREERATKDGKGVLTYTILTVDHTFYAEDGTSVVARTVGEAMDSGDKSSNKAMSAAMKYALIESLCIPTREPKDTENDSPEPAPRSQPAKPAEPARQRPWMARLQAAVAKLKLGEEHAERKGLRGKEREDSIRGSRLLYLSWVTGRDINSTLDLTDAEAAEVIKRAEAGETP